MEVLQTKLLTSGLSTGTWYHIAFVYKAGNISDSKVYLNGVDQSTTDTGTFPSSLSFSGLKTITAYYGTNNTFDGKVGEVNIWKHSTFFRCSYRNYNIRGSGRAADMNNLTNESTDPILWYRMGDGDTFPTVTDNGSGSNNGTMTNMVSVI